MTKLNCLFPQEVSATLQEPNSVALVLFVGANIDYFDGHFPQAPILAGVVQLDWAIQLGFKHLDVVNTAVKNVEVLKFQVVIQPEETITLVLEKKSEYKFTFKYESEKGVHSSGRIVLEES